MSTKSRSTIPLNASRNRLKSVNPQNIRALATDGDGTLLRDGRMGRQVVAALRRWRQAGKKVLLITGETPEQLCDFPHLELYDRVVAENGALLLHCGNHRERKLAKPPPQRLINALKKAGLERLHRGRLIFQAELKDARKIKRVLRETGTTWQLIHNKNELMIVPPGVSKATGLSAILKELKIRRQQVIAIGDAENDLAMFENCGLAVAVHNAQPRLKKESDVVTAGNFGKGIAELIDWLLPDQKRRPPRTGKNSPRNSNSKDNGRS
jgi:hydroxymethylpyrimidine pyrophosphatase-like HAD family hydrolase